MAEETGGAPETEKGRDKRNALICMPNPPNHPNHLLVRRFCTCVCICVHTLTGWRKQLCVKGTVLGTGGEIAGVDGAILPSSVNVVGTPVGQRKERMNTPIG